MRNNKGVTMLSVLIYVIALTIVVALIATMTSFFYANVINMSDESRLPNEFSKFNSYMLDETKKQDNEITDYSYESKAISFLSGNTYTIQDNGIYLNELKIFDSNMNLENSYFKVKNENGKDIVEVAIDVNDRIAFNKTVEYVLPYSNHYSIYQEESSYGTGQAVQADVVDGFSKSEGVCVPIVDGMTPIKWDTAAVPNESITTADDPDWYDYRAQKEATTSGGTSKWANAKTQNGSYLVWIPRYEYKITSGEHGAGLSVGQAGTIDVRFISMKEREAAAGYTTDANGYIVSSDGYTIHPAFTNSKNNGLGELSGIWVGKFESSNDGSGNVKIVPNVAPWININVSTIFSKCQVFSTNNSLSSYDSHMMKNTEWGAVAYLAHSQYGRSGTEVTANNHMNASITDFKTGYAGYTVNAGYTDLENVANNNTATSGTFPYNNTYRGVLASTTGNIYGVYDMSGGTDEYVMGVYTTTIGSSEFSKLPYTKYYDSYTEYAENYKGDAIYETSSSVNPPYTNSWFR